MVPKVGAIELPKLKASDCVAAARRFLDAKELLLTTKALGIASACARKEDSGAAYLEQIEAIRKQLDEAQDQMLAAAAKDMAAGKHVEALRRYHTYARKFAGLRIAKVAAEKIAQARKDPSLRSAEKRAESEAAYAEITSLLDSQWQAMHRPAKRDRPAPSRPPDEALVAAMPIEKQAAVLKEIRFVLANCAGTSAATKAAALDRKLRANKPLIEAVEKWQTNRDARALFLKASLYESAKAKDKAAQTYRLLLSKHPDCKYAAAAKSRLKNLR